jgi:hypothetical protein
MPATTGTIITSGDTGTVTNTMLAGSIANAKLLNSTISGIALGSNLATLTISGPLTGTSYNGSSAVSIGITQDTTSTSGYLSNTDWNTFNNKQPAGSYLTSAVTSATAGTGMSVSASTGAVTFTNTLPNIVTATTGSAPDYGARAWAFWNGTNGSIYASGNVSSVTRFSPQGYGGGYTVNFTTAMPDANYAAVFSHSYASGANGSMGVGQIYSTAYNNSSAPTTGSFSCVVAHDANNVVQDSPYVTCAVFR